jgi:hypothetical protein
VGAQEVWVVAVATVVKASERGLLLVVIILFVSVYKLNYKPCAPLPI